MLDERNFLILFCIQTQCFIGLHYSAPISYIIMRLNAIVLCNFLEEKIVKISLGIQTNYTCILHQKNLNSPLKDSAANLCHVYPFLRCFFILYYIFSSDSQSSIISL